jgi:hypothetical protein
MIIKSLNAAMLSSLATLLYSNIRMEGVAENRQTSACSALAGAIQVHWLQNASAERL